MAANTSISAGITKFFPRTSSQFFLFPLSPHLFHTLPECPHTWPTATPGSSADPHAGGAAIPFSFRETNPP